MCDPAKMLEMAARLRSHAADTNLIAYVNLMLGVADELEEEALLAKTVRAQGAGASVNHSQS